MTNQAYNRVLQRVLHGMVPNLVDTRYYISSPVSTTLYILGDEFPEFYLQDGTQYPATGIPGHVPTDQNYNG